MKDDRANETLTTLMADNEFLFKKINKLQEVIRIYRRVLEDISKSQPLARQALDDASKVTIPESKPEAENGWRLGKPPVKAK